MKVTVVVPARDAAGTLADALGSLRAQTFTAWEAIVVDDGSRDRTRAVAERLAAADDRVRLLEGEGAGVARARNLGIAAARHDAVLFLDADDALEPDALDRLVAALAADQGAGAAYCGWRREAPGGEIVSSHDAATADLFDELARRCPFAIHACLVRIGLVRAAGGFDEGLRCSEDWDLWQRLARSGARFAHVPGVLARYRLRPGSASLDVAELLASGLSVIERGHRPDPRVAAPDPRHAEGRDPAGLPAARWLMLAWTAAIEIGGGGDGGAALAAARGGAGQPAALDPDIVATCFEIGVPVGALAGAGRWPDLWWAAAERIAAALAQIEALSGSPGLARRAGRRLERAVAQRGFEAPGEDRAGERIGRTFAVALDWRRPLPELAPPPGTEVVLLHLLPAGGTVELPVCAPTLPPWLLADAVAAQAGREVLAAFGAARGEAQDSDALLADLAGLVTAGAAGELRLGAAVLGAPVGEPEPDGDAGARIVDAAGLELARVAVRDGILGRPVEGPPLPERLREGSSAAAPAGAPRLGRRCPGLLDAPTVRRALLPEAAAAVLGEMARAWGEPFEPGQGTVVRDPEALGALEAPDPTRAPARARARAMPILRLEPAADGLGAVLAALADAGWTSTALGAWLAAGRRHAAGSGRATILTFDAEPAAFGDLAWPLLRRHGFGATVFVATGAADWAAARALERDGVRFGAAGVTGHALTGLAPRDAAVELAASRLALARELAHPVCALAYPDGDADASVAHLAGAVGYECGLTRRAGVAGPDDDPTALPRVGADRADPADEILGGLA